MPRPRPYRWFATIAALALGCDAAGSTRQIEARDSAGVRIATNPRSALDEPESRLRLGDASRVQIGVVDGDPRYQLTRVQLAARLGDGRIVVADGGSRELRFFDAAGRFITAVGARGEGPGEFSTITGAWRSAGDSIFVWDALLRRITVFDGSGNLARTASIAAASDHPRIIAGASDGSFVRVESVFRDPGADGAEQHALHIRHDRNGAVVDTVGDFRDNLLVWVAWSDGTRGVAADIFGARTVTAALPEHYVVGAGAEDQFRLYTYDGELKRIVRWSGPDRTVTPENVERYRTTILDAIDDPNRRRIERERIEQQPVAERIPSYDQIMTDGVGRVWVARYVVPWSEQDSTDWLVFDPGGVLVGTASIPSDLRILEIGGDEVIGVWRDQLGVEYVQVHAIEAVSSANL